MKARPSPVDELFACLIERLEDEPSFDVQGFLEEHVEHAPALRARLERLRCVGLIADVRGESTLVQAMRDRFGVQSEVRTPPLQANRTLRTPGELLPSRVVGGRYRILAEIGRGGMGRVFRAHDLDLGREIALKVADTETLFLPGATAEEKRSWIERFLSEAQVTSQLEHPSIVPVHDIGVDRTGQLYYTMKLVEGETLEDRIRQWHAPGGHALPTSDFLRIIIQVCNALAFAHERGVVHRDLKPSNIMVGRFGEVQVMDWGLAKLLLGKAEEPQSPSRRARASSDSNTLAGEVLGTPTHMAPEQARGDQAAVDRRADVFGLGAVLYHGLHGIPPNNGLTTATPVRPSTRAPAELEAICRRALHPDPARRYPSAEALGQELQAFIDQRVVKAYEAGLLAELRKWMMRNKAVAVAGTLGLLVFLIAVVTFLLKLRLERRDDDFWRLAAQQDLDRLVVETDALWPALPERIPAYQDWLRRANELVEELTSNRAELEQPRGREEREIRWWQQQQQLLIASLEDLQKGLLAEDAVIADRGWSVPKRLAHAEALQRDFAEDGRYGRLWAAALPHIRNSYPELGLTAQLCLVPLGPDPASGLWEFAHLQTGKEAVRGPDGALVLKEDTGLVFVLLPGGAFTMGAQAHNPSGPNYDPQADTSEGPPHEVTLSPFFLSKYEMTQGQWLRFVGKNPSFHAAVENGSKMQNTLLHPVEQVSWSQCQKESERLGLVLPSEAQWEYGCRSGSQTSWQPGDSIASLRGFANIADEGSAQENQKGWVFERAFSDGWAAHCAIGSLKPNSFGLHEMHGNVWEWCRDGYDTEFYSQSPSQDPVSDPSRCSGRVHRGGSFYSLAGYTRSAFRGNDPPDLASFNLGIRPAMGLVP